MFLSNNDCETPYKGISIDLLSINFNLLSTLVFCIMFTTRYVILKSLLYYQQYDS